MTAQRHIHKHTASDSQVDNQIDKLTAAIVEKARIARVLRMRLGARVTDTTLAEQLATSTTQISKWRDAELRDAPTVIAFLLANDDVFDVLMRELCEARARLGHSIRHWSAEASQPVDQSTAVEQALERALAAVRSSRGR